MEAVAADIAVAPSRPGTRAWAKLWKRAVAEDSPADLARFGAAFMLFFALDRSVTRLAALSEPDFEAAFLVLRAVQANLSVTALVSVAGLVALILRPSEVLVRWSGLEHGVALRRMLAPAVVLVAWRSSTYDFNFLAGQWHWGDRILVVLVAVGVLARPVFLVPLAIQLRVMSQQFLFPTGQSSTVNLLNFVVFAILAVATVHLLYVVTRNRSTSPVLALLATMIASHFLKAGRGKLSLSWFPDNEIGNLAHASHLVGWLGGTDGEFVDRLAEVASSINTPLLLGTLAVELGGVVAVSHRSVLRAWLAALVTMHVLVFLFTGFWFLSWIVIELGLIAILSRQELRPWVRRATTPLRGLLSVLIVVMIGERLFYPPPLAWLDSPVSVAYVIEATGESGTRYRLAPGDFAPFEEDVAFLHLEFAPRQAIAHGYGAIYSPDLLRDLNQVDDFADLRPIESTLPATDESDREVAADFLIRYLDHVDDGHDRPAFLVPPPPLFWTAAPPPRPQGNDAIVALTVYRITSIHSRPESEPRREPLLIVALDPTGRSSIEWWAPERS